MGDRHTGFWPNTVMFVVPIKDVEYISEENVDTFSIRDVVLPLPGDSIVFPKNKSEWVSWFLLLGPLEIAPPPTCLCVVGELYLEALAKDSLSPEKMRHRVKCDDRDFVCCT